MTTTARGMVQKNVPMEIKRYEKAMSLTAEDFMNGFSADDANETPPQNILKVKARGINYVDLEVDSLCFLAYQVKATTTKVRLTAIRTLCHNVSNGSISDDLMEPEDIIDCAIDSFRGFCSAYIKELGSKTKVEKLDTAIVPDANEKEDDVAKKGW